MKPQDAIASLDAALAENGEDIVVRRVDGAETYNVGCRAFVRAVSPEKVVGSIAVTDLKVIISPTEILAAKWPTDQPPADDAADPRLPRINDFVVVKGKKRQVKLSDPIYLAGVWVRCNLTVAG